MKPVMHQMNVPLIILNAILMILNLDLLKHFGMKAELVELPVTLEV
jgi:hypothetical protein